MKRNKLRQGNTIYIAEVRFDSDTTRFTYSVIPCSIVLRKLARSNATDQIWPMLGYELRTKLAELNAKS